MFVSDAVLAPVQLAVVQEDNTPAVTADAETTVIPQETSLAEDGQEPGTDPLSPLKRDKRTFLLAKGLAFGKGLLIGKAVGLAVG